jgi:hypothetical protein
VASLLILLLLVVIGTSAVTTSTIEIQIAGNARTHNMAFYAAEAARSYVEATPDLYGPDNMDPPNSDPFAESLGTQQSFSGEVVYIDERASVMIGKGFSVAEGSAGLTAHVYQITSTGTGPSGSGASSEVEAGVYRYGFAL